MLSSGHWSDFITKSTGDVLFPPKKSSIYRPIYLLTYKVESTVFGLTPWGTRLFNLALHLMVVALFYGWLSRYSSHAWVGALLLGVHPIVCEPVSWSSGRHELIFGLCTVLILMMMDLKKTKWIFVVILLGALSKETFFPVSLALVLFYRYQVGRLPSVGSVVSLVAVYVLRTRVLGSSGFSFPDVDIFFRNFIFSMSRYVEVLLMPWCTGVFKARMPSHLEFIHFFQAIAGLGLVITLSLFTPKRLRFMLLIVFFTPIFTLSLIADLAGHVHDRYFYVPHLSIAGMFCLALPGALDEFYKKNIGKFFIGTVILALSCGAYLDSWHWQSYSRMIEKILAESSQNPQVHLEAAQYSLRMNDIRSSKKYLNSLLMLTPQNIWARNVIAVLYVEESEFEAALEHLKYAYQLNQGHFQTSYNLGFYFEKKGSIDNAVKWYQQAQKLKPTDAPTQEALSRLGVRSQGR